MVVRQNASHVLATQGVADGEKVILTKVDMPVLGMTLEPAKIDGKEEGNIKSN
jgi:antitoxin (DNA-binding transcriptional repressor) of toxin-antitoxin stability system